MPLRQFPCTKQGERFSLNARVFPPAGTLERTNYEVGVSYIGDQIGMEKPFARPMIFRGILIGGSYPRRSAQSATRSTLAGGTTVPLGTYALYALPHQYKSARDFTAKLRIRQHCRSLPTGPQDYDFPIAVHVYGRLPIATAAATVRRAKRGEPSVIK